MQSYKVVFKAYLESQGLKLTRSREIILEAVFATHQHFDVEALYQFLREGHSDVSRATIYRTIPYLLGAGLIKKTPLADNREIYEHIYGHPFHLHIVCLSCGKVVERCSPELEQMIRELGEQSGYLVTDYTVGIRGICSLCGS